MRPDAIPLPERHATPGRDRKVPARLSLGGQLLAALAAAGLMASAFEAGFAAGLPSPPVPAKAAI